VIFAAIIFEDKLGTISLYHNRTGAVSACQTNCHKTTALLKSNFNVASCLVGCCNWTLLDNVLDGYKHYTDIPEEHRALPYLFYSILYPAVAKIALLSSQLLFLAP
jgi:hypothetical protein